MSVFVHRFYYLASPQSNSFKHSPRLTMQAFHTNTPGFPCIEVSLGLGRIYREHGSNKLANDWERTLAAARMHCLVHLFVVDSKYFPGHVRYQNLHPQPGRTRTLGRVSSRWADTSRINWFIIAYWIPAALLHEFLHPSTSIPPRVQIRAMAPYQRNPRRT